jgi:hypothetical protein
MADDQDRMRRLETTLTSGLQTLLSNAKDTTMEPLADRLRRENIHLTQVTVRLGDSPFTEDEQRRQKLRDLGRIVELYKQYTIRIVCLRK